MAKFPKSNFKCKYDLILYCLIFSLFLDSNALAQTYPFTNLPSKIVATLKIDTTKQEAFKNQLLGYNVEGFDNQTRQDFIRRFDPVSIRFPHGVWANFYNWQTDGYQQDSYDNAEHEATLATYVKSVKGSIDNIASLNSERKLENNGIGFNMMWTYSMNFDDAASCVSRAKKDKLLGLELKNIELGNEHFWKNQRSNQVDTPEKYLLRAKSVASALHAEFPDVTVSIPLSWRKEHADYNKLIADNKTYFDAASIHVYTGADPDVAGQSNTAYESLLTARLSLAENVNWVRDNYAPNKPIWLTEWGVSSGSGSVHAAACLGMADTYLFMSENQHIYDRANWFSFNRVLNSMFEVGVREPVYPLKKRPYYWVYEFLHDVFINADMKSSTIVTTKLTTSKGVTTDAVSARVVTRNGKNTIIAVNLTNKPADLILNINEIILNSTYKHEAIVFDKLGEISSVGIDENVIKLIDKTTNTISLPPLSISKISNLVYIKPSIITSLDESNENEIIKVFPNPSESGTFRLTKEADWKLYNLNGIMLLEGNGDIINVKNLTKGASYILKVNGLGHKIIYQ